MAGLQRRGHGVEIELWAGDRAGLLSEVTKVLRESGLTLRRAEISTQGGEAEQRFLVWDVSGKEVDREKVEEIRNKLLEEVDGLEALRVKGGKTAMGTPVGRPLMPINLLRVCLVQRLSLIALHFLVYLC